MNQQIHCKRGVPRSRIILHAGLPRTATTVLQSSVFPKLEGMHFLGKDASNTMLRGSFRPLELARELSTQISDGDKDAWIRIRHLFAGIVTGLKLSNRDSDEKRSASISRVLAQCFRDVAEALQDRPILYSDESLCESVSALSVELGHGDAVPLEQLERVGLLEDAALCVVLRPALPFLRASYYKMMEFRLRSRRAPLSFDEFISRQLAIFDRRATSSRIFLACGKRAAKHYRDMCPAANVVSYDDLVRADHVLDTLLGFETGEAPVSLQQLPRENSSWRYAETNAFILSAPGVPSGIDIDSYAQTFPETLRRYGLDSLFASEALDAP